MATIKSDAAGFIIGGEPIKELHRAGGRKAEEYLSGILGEVRALRQAVSPAARGSGSRTTEGAAAARFSPVAPTGSRKGEANTARAAQPGTGRRSLGRVGAEVAQPAQRDERGRFAKKATNGDATAAAASTSSSPAGATFGAVRGRGVSIADTIGRSGMDEADPAVKAFGEVAQPLARGYQALAGGDKAERQKTGWFRKIFGELHMFRAEETAFSKAAGKSLKALEEKPEAGAAAGGGGMLGTVMNGIKAALPGIATVLGGLAAAMAPLLAMLKVTEWAADTTHDKERVEGIKEGAAAAAKEALKTVGIDKDAEIAKARADTLEKRDGEYSKEAADRAVFAPSGVTPGTRAYEDAFYRAQQEKEAQAEAAKKKGFVQRGIENVKSVGRAVFGNRNKDAMVKQMAESGITDPKEQAMFLAQLDHESGGFSKNEESFKYKSADRLMQVSASARKKGLPAVEQAMAQGPEAVAELMYGGRMGNKSPGDAYNFRGRGAIQLTGRANYARAGKALGLDLENHPELAAAPENSAKVAAWYWKDAELGTAARRGDVRAVTKGINGGANGLDDRTEKYGKYLSAASAGAFGASAPVVASMPNAPTVRPPSVPTVADASPMVVPLSSGGGKPPVVVSQAPADVGQDVRDRRIAHIATGGVAN